jgi:hypothetical protein
LPRGLTSGWKDLGRWLRTLERTPAWIKGNAFLYIFGRWKIFTYIFIRQFVKKLILTSAWMYGEKFLK